MNLALFAGKDIGLETVSFLSRVGQPISCLLLDSKDPAQLSDEIKRCAKAHRVIYSDALVTSEGKEIFSKLDIDIILLAWWPYLIPESIFTQAKVACLNFHNSLLPFNRGKHPNFWSIVEQVEYGVSIHHVTRGIDDGGIAFQTRIPITWEDSGKTLYEKGKRAIVDLFKEHFEEIRSLKIPRIPQDLKRGSFHLSSELENASRIDLEKSYTARDLLNLLRARTFPPYPAAWFLDDGQTYEVRVEISKKKIGSDS